MSRFRCPILINSGFCILSVVCCVVQGKAQTTMSSATSATTASSGQSVGALPLLSLNVEDAPLSKTIAALNRATGVANGIIAGDADEEDVDFSLNGKMTFGQAICKLHAQHPLRLQRVKGRVSLMPSTSKFMLSDAGTAIAQMRVVVRSLPLGSGPRLGMFGSQPHLEFEVFFDPRLKVKALTRPKIVELVDEKGNGALSERGREILPPSDEFHDYPANRLMFAGSIDWSQMISRVKWTMRVQIEAPTTPGGSLESTITGELKNITAPPRGTPAIPDE
jgi:hypothetical protein